MKNHLSLSGIFLTLCLSVYSITGTASPSAKKDPGTQNQSGMNTVKGEGPVIDQDRAIDAFTSISVEAPVQVSVVRGNRAELILTGYANHLSWVKTRVKDGRLIFSFDSDGRKMPPDQKIRATVKLPGNLTSLFARSQGKINVEKEIRTDSFAIDCSDQGGIKMGDLQAGKLTKEISGQGDVELAGSATETNVRIANQGDGDLKKLKAVTVDCTVSGQGDCTVYVTGKLKAVVSDQGDLTYYGSPDQVEQQVTGQADLTEGK